MIKNEIFDIFNQSNNVPSGNTSKMQRLTSFLQQLAPLQDQASDGAKDWCGRGSGVTNITCPNNDMVCYKETWDLDGQASNRLFKSKYRVLAFVAK